MKQNFLIPLIIVGFVLVFGIAITGAFLDQEPPKEPLVQTTAVSSVAPSQQSSSVLPDDPYQRIVAIVERYGEYPVISDIKNPNAKTPQSPFDVSVVLKADSCRAAQLHAFELIRDLYTDAVTAPALARVIVVTPKYLTTSLGASAARQITAETWRGIGSSYFVDSLKKIRDHAVDESYGLAIADLTFVEKEKGCLK